MWLNLLLLIGDDVTVDEAYAAFFCAAFHFAQRTLWAAAILLRAARDIRLRGRAERLPVV